MFSLRSYHWRASNQIESGMNRHRPWCKSSARGDGSIDMVCMQGMVWQATRPAFWQIYGFNLLGSLGKRDARRILFSLR